MNLACWVTLSRLFLLPVALLSVSLHWRYGFLIAAFICLVAGLTDIMDGYLARRSNSTTTFGSALDPLADKVFVSAMLILLASRGAIPYWVPGIVILREVIISLARARRLQGRLPVNADRWGKAKTVVTMIAIIGLLLRQELGHGSLPLASASVPLAGVLDLAWWLMLLAVALTLFSGANYLISYSSSIRGRKALMSLE